MKLGSRLCIVGALALTVAWALLPAPSRASGTVLNGADWTYAGSGSQYFAWDFSARKLRISVTASSGMSPERCMDGMMDWRVAGGSHYDARIVRNCRPGSTVETDPGGDGFWQEPSDWDGRNVDQMKVGVGYVMDDTLVDGEFEIYQREFAHPFTSQAIYGGNNGSPPTTSAGYWYRIRTLYQDGHITSNNFTPEHCYGEGNLPWNCT